MNEDLTSQLRSNRFIFTDDFYDKLEEIPLEKPVSFDTPTMISKEEVKGMETSPSSAVEEAPKEEIEMLAVNPESETVTIPDIAFIEKKSEPIPEEIESLEPIEETVTDSTMIEEDALTELTNMDSMEQSEIVETVNPQEEMEETVSQESTNLEGPIFMEATEQSSIPVEMVEIQEEKEEIPVVEEASNLSKIEEPQPSVSEIKPLVENVESPELSEQLRRENDIFDVETGIDRQLEKEVMDAFVEVKTPFVEDYGQWGIKPVQAEPYRASRNRQPEVPDWIKEEMNTSTYVPPKVLTDTSVYVQPAVINIDDELLKEEYENLDNSTVFEEEVDYDSNNFSPATKSNLLEELRQKEAATGNISILARYGDDFCSKDYVTNPAIGRKEEIKQLNLILLTPEKSAILVGKPGIGKTSIVEGLAYQLQRDNVPDALKGYRIISVKTTSLLGTLSTGETRLQTLIDELKEIDKVILFIDEVHMLIGATNESSLDFANMFKESLGRGSIKMIGATTSEEYERYVLRDKAFVRRFQRVDVSEPTPEQTVKILMGTLPKIEKSSGAKLKYSQFVQTEIMSFLTYISSEYKRVYGIGSRYPDICLTLLSQAFSHAVFDNRKEVDIQDIRSAIQNSKNIYPDVIQKELVNFDEKFSKLIKE